MTNTISIAYQLRIFTLLELADAINRDNPTLVSKLLQRWLKQGLVTQIRRNLYCMIDLATGLPVCNKYEIGSHLSKSSYISYHSALEFHGLAHQPFNEVFVTSRTRFNPFQYNEVDYTYCRQTTDNITGVLTPAGNTFVRVSDVELTLLDCFDRIDRAGGIEELLHCMESIVILNEEKLSAYLAGFNKAFLYQKTGYLLEQIKGQAHISDTFLGLCREKGTKSIKRLTNNDESDTFVNRWRMYVPQTIIERGIDYELI